MKWILFAIMLFKTGGGELLPVGPSFNTLEECDRMAPAQIQTFVHVNGNLLHLAPNDWVCLGVQVKQIKEHNPV